MLLQLALDTPDANLAYRLLNQTGSDVDIIEIGTPHLIRYGINIISKIKQKYPQKLILADLKIVDAGAIESRLAFNAGADIVTVLATAHGETIKGAKTEAEKVGGKLMVDLITILDLKTMVHLAKTHDALGIDYICLHTAYDIQEGNNPNLTFNRVRRVNEALSSTKLAIAGGLKPESIASIVGLAPEIVIVGEYITKHQLPQKAVKKIRSIVDNE